VFSAFDLLYYNVRQIVVYISWLELAKPKVESTDAHLSLYHLRQSLKQSTWIINKIPKLGTLKIKGCLKLWPCHFTLQSILRQKKSYGTSNISPCKNIILNKSFKRNRNPSRYYNSIITNLKFQHQPTYHLSKILI